MRGTPNKFRHGFASASRRSSADSCSHNGRTGICHSRGLSRDMTTATLMRVLLAVAVATATGVHEARAQRLPPAPQSPGAPTDSNTFGPWLIVGGMIVGGLIAVIAGKQILGDPGP